MRITLTKIKRAKWNEHDNPRQIQRKLEGFWVAGLSRGNVLLPLCPLCLLSIVSCAYNA